MPQGLTYRDALKILGDDESRMVTMLDAAATAGLTAWTATAWTTGADPGTALSLFDMKSDVIRYAGSIMRRMSEWRHGISRYDRTQRLVAAHAVIVVSSFFECLDEVLEAAVPGFKTESLGITRDEQAEHVLGGHRKDGYAGLMEFLVTGRLPIADPSRPFAEIREEIKSVYEKTADSVHAFIRGHAVHDALNETERSRMVIALAKIPSVALRRYDESYCQLIADSREFEVWAGLTENRAVGSALTRFGELLADLKTQRPAERTRGHLAMNHRAAMRAPIVATRQAPEGVVLPSLEDVYINPRCQVAAVFDGDTPASREWWQTRTEVGDINAFLVGHLTSPRAIEAPLVVLGDPGSGKSKLTEVLAARLLEGDFLPIRVELRDVAAESLVHEQIEQAIYRRPGERVGWHDLLQSAEGLLPVVLLDGFDEMVQATDVNRYNYFEQVRDFQRQQVILERPVAVIITSRTVVADRARFPIGSLALRLRPFDDEQIGRWVDVWNRHNSPLLAQRGLGPLAVADVIAQKELSEQPLLLLMLAIFDSTSNALRRSHGAIGRAELYQSLFMDFALREVHKDENKQRLSEEQLTTLAERELMRLAIVALSMFNRGRQVVREDELNHDLPILFAEPDLSEEESHLTPAQRATGRFFFIHKSEARQRADRARSYEFLHATFGEFFVAWLAVRVLRELAQMREMFAGRTIASADPVDDRLFYSVLSFTCLAGRAPVIEFAAEMLSGLEKSERIRCGDLLRELLSRALYPSSSTLYSDYEPVRHMMPRRMAAYTANMVILAVLASAGGVVVNELLGESDTSHWSKFAHLWRGFLGSGEWDEMSSLVRITYDVRAGSLRATKSESADISLLQTIGPGLAAMYFHRPGDYDVRIASDSVFGRIILDQGLLADEYMDSLLMLAIPFARTLGGNSISPRGVPGEEVRVLSVAHAIAQLDFMRDASPEKRFELYLEISKFHDPGLREQLLLRLREDVNVFSVEHSISLLRSVANLQRPNDGYVSVINAVWRGARSESDRHGIFDLIDDVGIGMDPELLDANLRAEMERR